MREVLLGTAVKHQSRAIAQSTNCETQKKGRALWQTNEMNGREFGIGANMPVANRIVRPPCPLSRSRPALSLTLEARVPHGHTQLLARAAGVPAPDAPSSTTGCWWVCPGSTVHPLHTLALAAGAPALGCTQHHTLSHNSTPRMVGVATVAAGQEQQRRMYNTYLARYRTTAASVLSDMALPVRPPSRRTGPTDQLH